MDSTCDKDMATMGHIVSLADVVSSLCISLKKDSKSNYLPESVDYLHTMNMNSTASPPKTNWLSAKNVEHF